MIWNTPEYKFIVASRDVVASQLQDYLSRGATQNSFAVAILNLTYDRYVQMLLKVDSAAACYDVDPMLWDTFSDIYKSDHGIRPHFYQSHAEVKQWFVNRELNWQEHESTRLEDFQHESESIADPGPEFLIGPVQSGFGHRQFKTGISREGTSVVDKSLRTFANRARRKRQHEVLSQAMKFQSFDVTAAAGERTTAC